MSGIKHDLNRRAQRTRRMAQQWKSDKAIERRQLRLMRKERELKLKDDRRHRLLYG